MAVPTYIHIFCDQCGNLIRIEKFGDLLNRTDNLQKEHLLKREICYKCTVKNFKKKNSLL